MTLMRSMRWSPPSWIVTLPDRATGPGEEAHFRALERLYAAAAINRLFPSRLTITAAGKARIDFDVTPEHFHAAGAAHGTLYFKMLDDAAFYACNALVTDRFLLTTAFNLHFTATCARAALRSSHGWMMSLDI